MKEEDILLIIDKLAMADISLAELNKIKNLIDTEDFIENFNLVTSLETALEPLGRELLRNEIKEASKMYHNQAKVVNLNNVKRIALPSIAAAIIVICCIAIFIQATDYNNPKNYRRESLASIK